MATTVINGPTILAGQSLSTALDCSTGTAVAVAIPANWKSALLTFQASGDGTFFADLFDLTAREISFNVIAGTIVRLPADVNFGEMFLKLRSGTRNTPIVQPEQQDFKVFLDRPGNL
jgi:hypothetical protein